MNNSINNEVSPTYSFTNDDDLILAKANEIMGKRLSKGVPITSSSIVIDTLQLKLSNEDREIFAMLVLDNQHRVIEFVELFTGTINECSVYPREVLKKVLELNGARVILCHNHPSGSPTPSQADKGITNKLVKALGYIDVRVLDHIVVGSEGSISFSEKGLI